ncbi:putative short chain dehydrogenase [Hyaloraphidium curvatum]|nr:putative short chain dehydrogenase [Hyaloraphidium curvatum]
MSKPLGIVVGVGGGLGESIARAFAAKGLHVALVARNGEYLAGVRKSIEESGGSAKEYLCDVTDEGQIGKAVGEILKDADAAGNPVDLLVYNPAYWAMGSFLTTPPSEFLNGYKNQVLGLVHFAQLLLPRMVDRGQGTVLVTGATASVRAGGQFSAFASAKFACRAVTQSLAREFGPKGIHVAHFIIDGIIHGPRTKQWTEGKPQDSAMDPDAIARVYADTYAQHRSAWAFEVDLRPYVEKW